MQICVSEGQQVKKGMTLFVIDSRNAQLELEAAQANLTAAEASANSAKLEYESNKNLFAKNIVSRYMLDNSENSYKQAQAAVGQARAAVSRAQVNLGFCTYLAQVDGEITDEALQKLSKGVVIKGYRTRPCTAERALPPENLWERVPPIRYRASIPTSWVRLTLTEGKNRQVRHMTAAVGFPTLRLIRVQIGDLSLGDLQPGEWRRVR